MAELQELVQAYENSFCCICSCVFASARRLPFTVSALSALDPAHRQIADFKAQEDVCNRKATGQNSR